MTRARTDPPKIAALYGALRSGTTLIRLILDAHPAIHCPGERDFLLDHLADGGGFDRRGLDLDRLFRASGLTAPDAACGRAAFAALTAQETRPNATLVLILHRGVGRLLDVAPDIPVVHLVRDPRDVAHSSIGRGWAGDAWHGVDHWLETEREWDRTAPRFAPGQTRGLRYEDLLTAPEKTLTEVCGFLGLDYAPAMLRYPERSTYAPIDPTRRLQWKRRLSERDLATVEHKIGAMLTARGYEPSGVAPRPPTPGERLRFLGRSKAARWRLRFRRYGLADPILEAVARRAGMRALERRVRARMDARLAELLK